MYTDVTAMVNTGTRMALAANDAHAGRDICPASVDSAELAAYALLRELLDLAYRKEGLAGVIRAATEAANYYREAASISDEPEFRRKPNLLRVCAANAFSIEWCRGAIEQIRKLPDCKAA
jgi:hypothetical protein